MASEIPPSGQGGEQVGVGETRPSRKRRFIGKLLKGKEASYRSTSRSRSTSQLSHTHKADGVDTPASGAGRDEEDQPRGTAENSPDDENTQDPGDETDMWAEAERKLREDPAKRKKLDQYGQILSDRFGEPLQPVGTRARLEQFQRFFELEMAAKELSDAGDGTPLDNYKHTAQRIIKVLAKTLVASNSVIAPATNTCLPAGVASTGVLVVASFCLKAVDQRERLFDSLENVAHSVHRIAEYEILCRAETASQIDRKTADNETKAAFIKACSAILEFQARVVCFLDKNPYKQFSRNMFEYDGWDKLLKCIKEAEERIFLCAQRQQMEKISVIFHWVDKMKSVPESLSHSRNDQWLNDKANLFLALLYSNTCKYREAKARNAEPIPGTCQWFTNHALFNDWKAGAAGTSNLLYVTADPGCGKSVLSTHLVDKVLTGCDEAVCYFFFKDDFPDQKTATSALCALVHQVFDTCRDLLTPELLNKCEARGEKIVSLTELWTLLVEASTTQKIVCVLDGLDECQERDMKALVRMIAKNKAPGLKFLLTSRPYAFIRQTIALALPDRARKDFPYIHVKGDDEAIASQIEVEITLVIHARVNKITEIWGLIEDEKLLLLEQLLSVKNRTYLWVSLVFDGLIGGKAGITKKDILALTEQPPKGIDEAYERILRRSHDRERTWRLLHLILGAQRPLTLSEVSVALELCGPMKPWEEVRDQVIPKSQAKDAIRDLCGLLVIVVDDRVYLLHQTAREFLIYNGPKPPEDDAYGAPARKHHGMGAVTAWATHAYAILLTLLLKLLQPYLHQLWLFMTNSWQHSMNHTMTNEVLAVACMARLQPGFPKSDEHFSFFEYAIDHWPDHYRQSGPRSRVKMGKAARDLCVEYPELGLFDEVVDTNGLRLASSHGLDGAVKEFLNDNHDLNTKSAYDGTTALIKAVENEHAAVVRLLLGTGKAEVDARDDYGRTPLIHAARNGRADIMQLLLETGKADVNFGDSNGETPLHYAAASADMDAVQLLLENEAEVNLKDKFGRTALFSAVKIKENDIKIKHLGFIGVIKLLLEKGKAEVNVADSFGRTPIFYAILRGTTAMVQLLLESGNAEINLRDFKCMTPLLHALSLRSESKALLLLATGKAEVNSRDPSGRTPLSNAVGSKKVVQLLLEKSAEVNSRDNRGLTPLLHAAALGYNETVQLLCEKNAEVDSKDESGMTALSYAARNGLEKTMKRLFEWNADVNSKDDHKRTPLFYAVKHGEAAIVKMLLDTGKVDRADESYIAAMEEARQRSEEIYNLLSAYKSDGSASDCHEVQEESLSEAPPRTT